MLHKFTCHECRQEKTHESDTTTGYGIDEKNNKVCFECCGKQDRETLINLPKGKKICLYLNATNKTITNWPGTLTINVNHIRTGRHNIAGRRYDTWFKLDGTNYHAVQYGDNTQICHVKKVA